MTKVNWACMGRPRPRISDKENVERKELYDEGLGDREIARRLQLHPATIASWREKRGLKPNYAWNPHRHFVDRDEDQRRRILLASNLTDRQIGSIVGRDRTSIRDWRKIRGLKEGFGNVDIRPEVVSIAKMHSIIADNSHADWLEEMGATVSYLSL